MPRYSNKVMATLDLGSNFIRMMIAQLDNTGRIHVLEDVWHATDLGRDTFSTGRIAVQTIHDTCKTLDGFVQLMKDYQVKSYRAVCTSGVREASNREYVLEQIRLRTGLKTEIINSAQERFFIYKDLRDALPGEEALWQEGMLIANLGMGGIEVSLYREDMLQFTEYIRAGSLRLRQILADLERLTLNFPEVMEEYLGSKICFVQPVISAEKVSSFVGIGGEMKVILRLCRVRGMANEQDYIHQHELIALFKEVSLMTTEQIIRTFKLHRNEADILLPSLIILKHFVEMTGVKGVWVPTVSLRYGLLADEIDKQMNTKRKRDFENDIIYSVWNLAKKFGIDEIHAAHVEKLSLSIFHQTRGIHRLKVAEERLLRIAAILHDVGHYISLTDHQIHSYSIISSQDILGISDRERQIISNLARYHNEDIPLPEHDNYQVLTKGDKMLVSKLAAILKLAEALDISHKQKIQELQIKRHNRDIIFSIHCANDTLLEEWTFGNNVIFFEEVMGFKPVIQNRRA